MGWSLCRGKDGGAVDRCALFVDAGYVLADGAMAVHGTRRAESVSWDYEGLLQLLSSLARERSGLPVLRCYWYEATMDGRRTAEQDALADVPGIKLRIAKIRPGRREGVETEIHRDLTTLARNNAISDALVVSAEEDLAQVIADVQDLGMRVTLVHIAVDGNWTISRALRQESDDIIEISGDHLRPYVELVAGAEPVHLDEDGDLAAVRPLANGHSTAPAASYQQAPAAGNHAPPAIYTAPVVAEYQRPALQLPRSTSREDRARDDRARDDRARDDRARDDRARDDRAREERATSAVSGDASSAARQDGDVAVGRPPGHPVPPGHARARPHLPGGPHLPAGHRVPARHLRPGRTFTPRRPPARAAGPNQPRRIRSRRTRPRGPVPPRNPPPTRRRPARSRRDPRSRCPRSKCPRARQSPRPTPLRPRPASFPARASCAACRPRAPR